MEDQKRDEGIRATSELREEREEGTKQILASSLQLLAVFSGKLDSVGRA
jgi:hypothetical protein